MKLNAEREMECCQFDIRLNKKPMGLFTWKTVITWYIYNLLISVFLCHCEGKCLKKFFEFISKN